jgi:hypothetical protein
MDDVVEGQYSMTCVFLGDEGCNCANLECNKHWGDDRGAKVCPHCGHTEQMWWASWVEHMRQWQASGQKGYFVYNASVKLGPGQRTEKQYLDDNGLEYEEVTMEQFHLIRRPDRRYSVMPIQQHNPTAVKPNYTPGTAIREEAVEQHSLDFPEHMSGGVSSAGFVHSNPLHMLNLGRPSADVTDVKL